MSEKRTVRSVLNISTQKLSAANIESPRLDAEILLAYVLNCQRLSLYVEPEKILSHLEIQKFEKMILRRLKGFPIAYLIGMKEFMGLEFLVDKNVLVPRADTEILTEIVIKYLRGKDEKVFADLGVGSGAISISILKFLENTRAEAVDISEAALNIARLNALRLQVSDRIIFHCGDLFAPLKGKIFDAIISNPPYIPTNEIEKLQPEVQNEPRLALDGGIDGLDFYRRIISSAPIFLKTNGLLALEIGKNQVEFVKNLIKLTNEMNDVTVWKDLSGMERVVSAIKE